MKAWALLLLFASLPSFAQTTPKTFEVGASLQPQDVAFTQKLSTVRFEPNSEAFTFAAYSLFARYNHDNTRFFELEHSETQYQAPTYNTSVFNVKDSKVSLDQTLVRAFFCKPEELERQRFCWGVEAGRDAVPALTFEDANTLSLDEVRSFVVGPSALYQFPASQTFLFHVKAWTLFGLSAQGSDKAELKSDWKFGAQAGASEAFDENQSVGFAMDYYVRQSKIQTPHISGTQTWNVISSAVVFHLSYTFSF